MTMGVLAGVLSIAPPVAFRIIFNQVLVPPHGHPPDLKALYLALGLTSVALILANCAIYGQTYLTAWSGQHLVARLRVRLFGRLLNLPLGEFDKWRPGELIARFSTDLQIMIDAVSVSVPQLVVALATFISSFATMIYLDWLLTLSLVLVAPIVSFAVSNFQRLISASTHRAQQRIADLTANLSEILGGQRVVKSFGREEFEVGRFRTRNDDFFGAYMKLTQFIQTQPLVISTIMVAAVVAIMWLSVREVLVGRLDIGKVFMYWGLLVNLMNPMNRVAAFFGDISKAVVGAGRVFELLDLPVEVRDPPGAVALTAVRGKIEYRDVTFRYKPADPPALRDVNATIEAGEIVALVGPSGAGKTTIVNLVPRFYAPQEGRVLLDGVDIGRCAALRLAQGDRDRAARRTALPRFDSRKHSVWPHRGDRFGSSRGRSRRQRRRVRARLPGWLCDTGRRARDAALRRRAPAYRDRACRPARPADLDSGRGHQCARQPLRGDDRAGSRPALAGTNDADHRASALDRATRA